MTMRSWRSSFSDSRPLRPAAFSNHSFSLLFNFSLPRGVLGLALLGAGLGLLLRGRLGRHMTRPLICFGFSLSIRLGCLSHLFLLLRQLLDCWRIAVAATVCPAG